MKNTYFKTTCLFFLFLAQCGYAQEIKRDSIGKFKIDYGSKGFEFKSENGDYLLQIQSRLQFRYSTPDDQDPITFDEYNSDKTNVFKINRARLKVGGNAFQPWLKYYWEYELNNSNILDWRVMVEKWEWLSLKVGQWKVEYSRERRISSGEQQLVDRSIINRPFTVDRQQGVEVYGHVDYGGIADFNYWAAILTGTGRGNSENDDRNLMYFGRFQWNFLGEELGFEASDLSIHEKPIGIIALAGVTNRSSFTRFSQSGGGELVGFENGLPGQYRTKQINFETAFMYKGFSWQSELHHKEITDKLNGDQTSMLRGYYLQGGYFFHQTFEWWPEQLEAAARFTHYDPGNSLEQEEKSFALNWFFKGHKNKLTMEVTNFDYEVSNDEIADKWRFRFQWDISL